MAEHEAPKRQPSGKYGLRFDEMSAEEREYYREFWQEPEPEPKPEPFVSPLRLRRPKVRPRRARWFWVGHALVVAGIICGVITIAVIPEKYGGGDPVVLQNYITMWSEITMLLLLAAAILYVLVAMSVYTPEDDDDSVIRPTDYADRQLEKDLARGRRRDDDDDFYDSSWISRK